jgi:hypothetical protein
MNVIDRIIDILKQYPEVRYEFRSDAIRALAAEASGYEVALLMQPQPCYTVCLATWHMEFADENSAIGTFLGGLTDAYRLKVSSRGGRDYRWTIQYRDYGTAMEARSSPLVLSFGEGRRSDIFKITYCDHRRTQALAI